MAKLAIYRAKRDFGHTAEPRGRAGRQAGNAFVIQKHAATRLHYDLRLELNGVMLSWAVTRGPSLVPGEKRLAIHVEDHPLEYNRFEGTIPKGQYGGGTVMIWDRGKWSPEGDPEKGMKKGHLDFTLNGKKLGGRWHLVRMRKRSGERQEPWLLIKSDDEFARTRKDPDILKDEPDSVASGRTIEEIAQGRSRVWHSNRPASEQSSRRVTPRKQTSRKRVHKAKARSRALRQKSAAVRGTASFDAARIPGARKAKLPAFVSPSLAALSAKAPATDEWLHEIKFDGYRIQARIEDGKVQLRTRTGLDWTEKFPAVVEALALQGAHNVIIDGEVVSGDAQGVSDFSALQDDLKRGRHDRMVYYAFDLLHRDGHDLTGASLIARKAALETLLAPVRDDGAVRYSEHFDTDGPSLLKHACRMQLEGVVSKRRDAPYRSGRNGDWRKTKCANSQEFVVAGYGPSDVSPRRMRALILAYHGKDGLTYAGRVGTGFSDQMRDAFWKRLQPLRIGQSPFGHVPDEERGRPVHWVEPRLVVEADFRGWTGAGRVRQASFKGLREDKPAKQVVREVEAMPNTGGGNTAKRRVATKRSKPAQKKGVSVAGVSLTHPDRVYWDDAGITKEMLANYYETVWDRMRPHVAGRVLALVRCPDGQSGQCFYQKHASAGIDTERLIEVKEPDGEKSIAIDNVSGLIALAQSGVLEVHVRGSTIARLEEADRLVFDLDPGPGVDWKTVIAAAREVRRRLAALKLKSFVKTTGGKGLHVVLPIRATPWDVAKDFCRSIAEDMAAAEPGLYTATIRKSARKNKIFVDYLRNSREATAIAPYSTRARPGATVAVPLSWEELGTQKAPNLFSVKNLPRRLAKQRKDPWAGLGGIKQSLPKRRKGP